jgi:hypothetical protein
VVAAAVSPEVSDGDQEAGGGVRARLIFRSDWGISDHGDPVSIPRLWPADKPIPDSWEEVVLESDPTYSPPPDHWTEDLCACGHNRKHHIRHGGECMEKQPVEPCGCQRFEGVTG